MFAVTLLYRNALELAPPSGWSVLVWLAVIAAMVVCAFMALPTRGRKVVAGLTVAVVLAVGVTQLQAAEVPGLMCTWFWIVAPWICWP